MTDIHEYNLIKLFYNSRTAYHNIYEFTIVNKSDSMQNKKKALIDEFYSFVVI